MEKYIKLCLGNYCRKYNFALKKIKMLFTHIISFICIISTDKVSNRLNLQPKLYEPNIHSSK